MQVAKINRIAVAGDVKGKAYTETELLINLDGHGAPLQSIRHMVQTELGNEDLNTRDMPAGCCS
jgi:hypothetical protein